jgi:hypothetical protein
MNSKKIWQILTVAIIAVVLVIGVSIFTNDGEIHRDEQIQEARQSAIISLTIESLYENKQVSIDSSETVLEVLQGLNNKDPQLRLVTKEFSDLGTLVESINGMKNGMDNKYWQYEVNGVMPQVGADKLELKNGDAVYWYFTESEF